MDFYKNTLLEYIDATVERKIDRVLWISPEGSTVVLIQINDKHALPRFCKAAELDDLLKIGALRRLQSDPFSDPSRDEENIAESYQKYRDGAWSLIAPVIQMPGTDAFDRRKRGPTVEKIYRSTRTSKWLIYQNLRRYWQGGQTKNALLPKFKNCGAAGLDRRASKSKRGRPRNLTKINGSPPGVNITTETRRLFRLGIKTFFENTKDPTKRTLREAYRRTMERFFNNNFEMVNGIYTPVMPPVSDLPTFEQYRYWFLKDGNSDNSLKARVGERRYNLTYRALGGDAAAGAYGPGSVFQVDSTIGDVYLVSSIDRKRSIGRPTIYMLVDVFTRMITGFCAVVENPNYCAAMLALENTAQDKVAFCATHGITISEAEWPSHFLPETLVADRGELLGNKSNHLVDAFGMRISNTPPYRADLKPFIERMFGTLNRNLIHLLPGAVPKPHQRGENDYRLDARLDIKEFRKAVIHFILHHNRSRIEGYRPRDFMVTDSVEPRPMDLWAWGIKNRSGHLLTPDEEFVKLNLLPGDQATVTEKGIRFRKVYYTCDRAVKEHWFATARQSGSWRIDIAYDPRDTSTLILRLPKSNAIERCQLMRACSEFERRSWEDVDDFFSALDRMKDDSRSGDLQGGANYHANIDALVKSAKAKTEATLDGVRKAVRTNGIRANRKVEREFERSAGLGDVVPDGESTSIKVTPNEISPQGGSAPENYVGLPMDIETLEQQREELCKSQ
jgi:putative transposase